MQVHYLYVGTGEIPIVLLHDDYTSAVFFQDFMLALAQSGDYQVYAPDLRGFGNTEALPIDATHGISDFTYDLYAFTDTLKIDRCHLFGWGLGGAIAMQFLIEQPERIRSLALQAPISPFGFGGTRGAEGEPIWPDFAGSGAGDANTDFVENLAHHEEGNKGIAPRSCLHDFIFHPSYRPEAAREECYLAGMLHTKVSIYNYPGDVATSNHWPYIAPGKHGVENAISPKYLNLSRLPQISPKPPIIWIRGNDDRMISDRSLFDLGYLGEIGVLPYWPGSEAYPAQPMLQQTRHILKQYQANGGDYLEIVYEHCGHAPHIEKQQELLILYSGFVRDYCQSSLA